MTVAESRDAALESIATLARAHGITAQEIAQHLSAPISGAGVPAWLIRAGVYLGGAFVLAGLGLLLDLVWGDLGSAARVVATYGTGLALFGGGIALRRGGLLSTPLILLSAGFLPWGMFVFLREYGGQGDAQLAAIVVFALLAAQYLGAFSRARRGALVFFGAIFACNAAGLGMDYIDIPGRWIGISLGAALLAAGERLTRTPHHPIAALLFFLGAAGAMSGVFTLTEGAAPWDLAGLMLAVGLIMAGVRVRSRTLIATAILGALAFVAYYTYEYFQDIVGWPVALIFMGVALMGAGALAVRLMRGRSSVQAPQGACHAARGRA